MRIGIFGGSFSPVHPGHLKLAAEALSALNLDRIVFVPSYRTPLKNKPKLLPWKVRVTLLKKALKATPRFSISLCEIERGGLSYTVDTLRAFKKKFGKKLTLYFISGADTLKNFHRWKSPETVLKLCRFVVFSRPGYSLRRAKAIEGALRVPIDALEVSSTEIRARFDRQKKKRSPSS